MLPLFLVLLLGDSANYRLKITPFDFQRNENQEFLTPNLSGLECDSNFIYIRSGTYPEVYMLDMKGQLIKKVGGKGDGPSELGHYSPLAMSLNNNGLYIIDSNYISARYFKNGDFISSFRLASYLTFPYSHASNAFTFSEEGVLIPSHRSTGALGYFYMKGEAVKPVGKILEVDNDLVTIFPHLSDTMWQRDEKYWYCCFLYFPIIQIFNNDLEQINQFNLDDPLLQISFQKIIEFIPTKNKSTHANPLFTDFKIEGDYLYIMAEFKLYEIKKNSGKINAVYAFFKEERPPLKPSSSVDLNLNLFCLMDSRTLLLASGWMPWEHDLWKAELP